MKTRIRNKYRPGSIRDVDIVSYTVATGEYGTLVKTESSRNTFPAYVQPADGKIRERYPEIDVRKSLFNFYIPSDTTFSIDQEVVWDDNTFQLLEVEQRWTDGKYVKLLGVAK